MTSSINYSPIDTTYPVAGKDNDSQGFRDNFTAIKSGLQTANNEISKLQANTLLSADLTTSVPTPVVNNMHGSTLSNGKYKQFNGTFYPAGAWSSTGTPLPIDINNGPLQKVIVGGNITLQFVNWPAAGNYAKVLLMLVNADTSTAKSPVFSTELGGVIRSESSNPSLTNLIGANTNAKFYEAWTVDKGTNVFLRYLGDYPYGFGGGTVTTTMTSATRDGTTASSSFTVASIAGINIGATFPAPPNSTGASLLTVSDATGSTITFTPGGQIFTTGFALGASITFTNP
jgi:hypothetical protein